VKPVAPIEDVLSFLNEIDQPRASLEEKKEPIHHSIDKQNTINQSIDKQNTMNQSIDKQNTIHQPILNNSPPKKSSPLKNSFKDAPINTESSSGWSWDSIGSTLWGQAQAATSKTTDTLTKSLQTARHFAGETAKSLNVDEQVKKVIAAVPTKHLANIGTCAFPNSN
jgi:hypothetical protein